VHFLGNGGVDVVVAWRRKGGREGGRGEGGREGGGGGVGWEGGGRR